MNFTVKCSCGKLLGAGMVKPTKIKKKMVHLIHYTNITGSFYLDGRDNLIVCSLCGTAALIPSQ